MEKIQVSPSIIGKEVVEYLVINTVIVTPKVSALIDYTLFTKSMKIVKSMRIKVEGEEYNKWNDDSYLEEIILNKEGLSKLPTEEETEVEEKALENIEGVKVELHTEAIEQPTVTRVIKSSL